MTSIESIVKRLRENRRLNEMANYSEMSLNDIIALCQDGDQQAIEYLLKEYDPLIKKISSRYFMDSQDKDDIYQIASIGFWDAIMKWDPEHNNEGGFVKHATLFMNRKLTDELRKDSTEKAKLNNLANSIDDTISDDGEGGDLTIGDTLASKDASPEEQYLGKSGARELMEFMRDKFSQAERDVIMRYIRGYKVSEIAEETGMKYKSVENALMRVKNKLADYLRTRESKKIRESKGVNFSDEEKQILESVITKVNKQEKLRESTIIKLKESYENYTEEQLDDELEEIEEEIDEISSEMEDTDYDDRDELLARLDDLRSKLMAMEDYLTDEQYAKAEDLHTSIKRAEDREYAGPTKHVNPYVERGLRQSDFY